MPICLGCSGAGKWFGADCIPESVTVVENRFVLTQPTMQAKFWDVFATGKRQLITLDMWQPSGHYQPSETELRQVTSNIKTKLIGKGIGKDGCAFILDNEPAKYGVNAGLYCWQANVIHDELNGKYDLYVGSDEVSYRNWYNDVVPGCANEGIAFHLQNCALTAEDVDNSVNFIKHLADTYQKKTTCSEGNYGDPANINVWNLIQYQINACKRIGALDYCVIFLELKNQDKYRWLSFKYNDVIRSDYYDDYLQLIENEKRKVIDGMIIKTIGHKTSDVKSGYGVELLHELLIYKNYMDDVENMFIYTDATKKAIEKFQDDLGITIDGRVGRQGWRKFINSIEDSIDREKFQFDFEVVMSPYNLDGDT